MKKLLYQLIILTCYGIFILCVRPAIGTAEIIFSDDFSSWDDYLLSTDDWSPPNGWTYANGGTSASFDGVLHYAGEVTTPGRNGSNDRSLKIWRHSTFYYDYDGSLEYREAALHTTRELYTRWYMKIPSDFTLAEGECNMGYLKMWRYNYDVNVAGTSNEIYLNFNGSSFTGASMQVYAVGDTWRTLLPSISEIRDDQWHCHELRLKLNTTGNSDAEIQYWLDGVEKAHITGLDFGAADNEYFSRCALGIGNTGARHCSSTGEFQSTWRAIEFDDYVLSTTYIGPDGKNPPPDDNEPPSKPTSLQDTNVSSTQVNIEWNASTDNVGVTEYNIYRNGSKIGSSGLPSYSDNSLMPNTTYSYSVSAFDAATNESELSDTIQVTTPESSPDDNEPPSKPTFLQEINVSSTQVNIEWNASTDNVGVAGYKIYRNGSEIGSSGSPSYSDNILMPNTTYSYSVSALDVAANESDLSDAIQVTTPESSYNSILFETWENNNINNWDDDLVVGDTHIDTDPVYDGTYAIKMESSNAGNYAHFFGDHPGVDGEMVTDVTFEEHYYLSPGFQWPEGLKLWIMNCFESWGAGYNLAEGQGKPHTWAPYYMTTWVNNRGELAGQLVRADGLGGTGALWQNYYQNVGSPVSLSPGTWNKIKIRLKLNTPGSSDGIYQIWLNDELKCNYSNLNYRGTYTTYGWNHLMMSMHGYPAHPQSQWISRDNIHIFSGVEVEPEPSTPSAPSSLRIISE